MSSIDTTSEATPPENHHSLAPRFFVRLILNSLGVISVTALWQFNLRSSEDVTLWHRWSYFWLISIVMLIELAGPRFDFIGRRLKLTLTIICAAAFFWIGVYFIPSMLFFRILTLVPIGLFIWAARGVLTRVKSVVLVIATLGTMLSLNPIIAHFIASPALAKIVSISLNIAIAFLVWHTAQASVSTNSVYNREFYFLRALLFVVAQEDIVSWMPEGSLFAEILSSRLFWIMLAAWTILNFFDVIANKISPRIHHSDSAAHGFFEWLLWLVAATDWTT